MPLFELDHLAIACQDLESGARAVEDALGVPLEPGGRHEIMATWNRLLSLGPGLYLEVIAPDPLRPPPDRPRWFGLDRAPARATLTNWVCRTHDMTRALAMLPEGSGTPTPLRRDGLSWEMAVPDSGRWPLGGAVPALIRWEEGEHPSRRLPDRGCRLVSLAIRAPEIAGLLDMAPELARLPGVTFAEGPPSLTAQISTPTGLKVLT